MEKAIKEADKFLNKNEGGPFGAVIVKDGKIIATAHNTVIKEQDATCHAEVNAIRVASKKLKTYDLSDCEMYSTSMPCPMCIGAIAWAKIKKVYYGTTIQDTEKIGFGDQEIYDFICDKNILINLEPLNRDECLSVQEKWNQKKDKTNY